MNLTETLKTLLQETVKALKGPSRRRFMAQTVQELGWNRETIRKGAHEVRSGMVCLDNYSARGWKSAEEQLPNLLRDITAMVDSQSQTDPQFRTQRIYTRDECDGSAQAIDKPERVQRQRTSTGPDDQDEAE